MAGAPFALFNLGPMEVIILLGLAGMGVTAAVVVAVVLWLVNRKQDHPPND